MKYTGYGKANELLNELEELKLSSDQRARNLLAHEDTRIAARACADSYSYCQMRLMHYFGGSHESAPWFCK